MKHWRHVICNTKCSWLHGDPRGFRSRGHRIHSSGDYRKPPPDTEHKGLHRFHLQRSQEPVSLNVSARVDVVEQFVRKLRSLGHAIVACSCGAQHVHALVELPADYEQISREVGKAKQKVSHFLRGVLPGSMWSAGGEFKLIRDADHLRNTYNYIREKQEAGTVVWSHSADEDWILDPQAGIVLMQAEHQRIRVFGVPQTPASDRTREDPGAARDI